MESRKYQLQQQIKEALKANDNDLYSLLKSQWAHRFGVESLEELEHIKSTHQSQNTTYEDSENNDQSKDELFEVDKQVSIEKEYNKRKEDTNKTNKVVKTVDIENKESFEIKSNDMFERENLDEKTITSIKENKNPPKVNALIPLPPKPKYGFLSKWLLRSKF